MPAIDWSHNRERLVLPVVVLPGLSSDNPLESVRVEGLIDTGATGTGVHPDVVQRLSLRLKGRRRVFTANGVMIAPEYMLRLGFVCGDHRDPDFDPNAQYPYVLDRELTVRATTRLCVPALDRHGRAGRVGPDAVAQRNRAAGDRLTVHGEFNAR